MLVETNKAIVRRLFEEVYNRRNWQPWTTLLLRTFNHNASFQVRGPKTAKQAAAAQFDAFPDSHTTIEDIIAEGDKVVVRPTDHFTRQPDGKQVALTWMEILRLENGKVVEAWAEAGMSPIPGPLNEALARR
jgi:predicted ester cyclase